MIWTRAFRWGLLCVLAVVAVFAANAFASEYNLKMRPEIGRCIKVGAHGEFRGARCTLLRPPVRLPPPFRKKGPVPALNRRRLTSA